MVDISIALFARFAGNGRILRARFRRDPQAYLRELEHQLRQLTLPA